MWASGAAGGGAAGIGTAGTLGAAAFVTLPIVAGGTVYMNVHRKHQIEAEFNRRRLVLPLHLAPGQAARGSFFFRITPSPQQLTLDCRTGESSSPAVIDLAPLAGLHVRQDPSRPTPAQPSAK